MKEEEEEGKVVVVNMEAIVAKEEEVEFKPVYAGIIFPPLPENLGK